MAKLKPLPAFTVTMTNNTLSRSESHRGMADDLDEFVGVVNKMLEEIRFRAARPAMESDDDE